MAKQFKDFTFMDKRLSSLSTKYVSSSFEQNDTINLALGKTMESGSVNRYKNVANYFTDVWNEVIKFDLCIIKDKCVYKDEPDQEITKNELREITRWLTSPHLPSWLQFEYETSNDDAILYHGWFNNIEPWVVNGKILGLTLSFECTSSFAFTDNIINEANVTVYHNMLVSNDSDDLYNYSYPVIEIHPKRTEQIFICNQSDCNLLESGILAAEAEVPLINTLLDKIENYALLQGYTVEYANVNEEEAFNIVPICNDTAIQFYFIDNYNNRTRCTAYYLTTNNTYYIIEGGFLFLQVYRDLPVYIDCEKLMIYDDIGRMVTFDKLGISDVDSIYWLRLINGNNSLLLYGNFQFKISHSEARKTGEF